MPKSKKTKRGGWFWDSNNASQNTYGSTSGSSSSWWPSSWSGTKKNTWGQSSSYGSPSEMNGQNSYQQDTSLQQNQNMNPSYSMGGRKRMKKRGGCYGSSSLALNAAPVHGMQTAQARWVGGRKTRKHRKKRSSRKH